MKSFYRVLLGISLLTSVSMAMEPLFVGPAGLGVRRAWTALPKFHLPQSGMWQARRWCSITPFNGQFVTLGTDGIVHIQQPIYPKFQELVKNGYQLFASV